MLLERGLDSQVEYILCNPFNDAAELNKLNPLGKIPTMVLQNGMVVYDSPVICEYLDNVNGNDVVTPPEPARHLLIQTWQALADGIIDASYQIVMEGRRSENERSPSCIKRWQENIVNSIEQVEQQIKTLPENITIAHISLGAALGYLDFRLSHLDWRQGHSETAQWYELFSQRTSMVATSPQL